MEIKNNSIVDTVIDYANIRFGMEPTADMVSDQLKNLSFAQTLTLVDAIKNDDQERFSDIIDLSAMTEAYGTGSGNNASMATNRQSTVRQKSTDRLSGIAGQKYARQNSIDRSVAGGNIQPTGTTAPKDPDDIQRDNNKDQSNTNADASKKNSQELERLRGLVKKLTS